MEPAVFLDRDNTLIVNDGDLGDADLVQLREGVPSGLKALRDAGYRLVVVTNQAGVARGAFSENNVDAVHQRIAQIVDEQAGRPRLLDRFYYCPYHPEATVESYRRDHPWRKPHPGMLLQAARDMGLDLAHSWMIGDQNRDVSAGRSAGCRTVLINSAGEAEADCHPTATATSFTEAVQYILQHTTRKPKPSSEQTTPALKSVPPRSRPSTETEADGPASPVKATEDIFQSGSAESLRRAVHELTEEVRAERLRRAEFTMLRMAAGLCQLLVLLLALLGLLQLANPTMFVQWMLGAVLMQLVTLTLLVADQRG